MGEPVCFNLTTDEALVLFEFLARFDENGTLGVQDQAEERVLWKLQGLLERQLMEPLHPEYKALLAAARARLRDPTE